MFSIAVENISVLVSENHGFISHVSRKQKISQVNPDNTLKFSESQFPYM